jgi:hypothetical protein
VRIGATARNGGLFCSPDDEMCEMIAGQLSRTAFGVAAHRAAHQLLEGGIVFADPLADASATTSPGRSGGHVVLARTDGWEAAGPARV